MSYWLSSVFLFALYALCAFSFTLAKEALLVASPLFFMGFRMTLAGLGLLLIAYFWGYLQKIAYKDLALWSAIILFHIYGAYVLDLISLSYLDSSVSALWFNVSPFVTALCAYLFLGEVMTYRKWTGLLLGFIGMSIGVIGLFGCSAIGSGLYWPEGLLLGAVVCSAAGWVILKKLMQKGYSFIFINSVGMIGGGILGLCTSAGVDNWYSIGSLPVTDWYAFLYTTIAIIIVSNGLFYNLYGYLLQRYSATLLSFAGFTCPLFAALFGYWRLHEVPTVGFWVSSAIVALGLYIFYSDELA